MPYLEPSGVVRTRTSRAVTRTDGGRTSSVDLASRWMLLDPFTWGVSVPDPDLFDDGGWPTGMVVRGGVLQHWVATLPCASRYRGVHHVTWIGQGTLDLSHEVVDRRSGRLTLSVGGDPTDPPQADALVLIITDTDPHRTGDHLRDVRFVQAGIPGRPCTDRRNLLGRPIR